MARLLKPEHSDTSASMPSELLILPLRNAVAFPYSMMPLAVGTPRSVKQVEEAMQGDRLIGLVLSRDPAVEEPQPSQVHEVGTLARIVRVARSPDDSLQVVVQGMERFRVTQWLVAADKLNARVQAMPETVETGVEIEALMQNVKDLGREVVELSPQHPRRGGGVPHGSLRPPLPRLPHGRQLAA